MALVASNAEAAQAAEAMLRERYDFVPVEEAELIVALGGDGFCCTRSASGSISARSARSSG